jgi:Ca2+:H+ antiporter
MLLAFVPFAIAASLLHAPAIMQFTLASLAIVPLAGLIGEATQSLACRLGPAIGGLLNATFGNAAELIIALMALAKGLDSVVKASLTGSVIGNLLLVLGASLLAGGLRHPIQRFNRTAASNASTLMVLAAMALIVPAIFDRAVPPHGRHVEDRLSLCVSVVLIIAYALSLVFSFVTHKKIDEPDGPVIEHAMHEQSPWSARKAAIVLAVSTAFVAWMSEILVGAVEETSRDLGLTEVFVGVIVVAVVGNAAEHSTAVVMALKNQMDLAVGIALGSALQIALFVAPALVFASYARHRPLNLLFSPLEVVAVVLAVLIARMVAEDGESNWLEGAMLLSLYAILGLAFYFLPQAAPKLASM